MDHCRFLARNEVNKEVRQTPRFQQIHGQPDSIESECRAFGGRQIGALLAGQSDKLNLGIAQMLYEGEHAEILEQPGDEGFVVITPLVEAAADFARCNGFDQSVTPVTAEYLSIIDAQQILGQAKAEDEELERFRAE